MTSPGGLRQVGRWLRFHATRTVGRTPRSFACDQTAKVVMASLLPVFVFFTMLCVGVSYIARAETPQARGYSDAMLPALGASGMMLLVAAIPLAAFVFEGPGPQYQEAYYFLIRWLAWGGWLSSFALVLYRSIQLGPSWRAVGVAAWSTLLVCLVLPAATLLVALQV